MKLYRLIAVLAAIVMLSACGSTDISNVHELEFTYKYARVTAFGNQKQIDKTYTVEQACDFVSKYLPLLYTRNHSTVTGKEENLLYSDSLERPDSYYDAVKSYYTDHSAETEVSDIKVKHVIMTGGDAYVNVVSSITLTACESDIAAEKIGFENGIGSTVPCELNLKLKYENKEYRLFDIEWVEKEGCLLPFESYRSAEAYNSDEAEIKADLNSLCGVDAEGEIRENTENDLSDETRIGELKKFINDLAARQNNRNYKTLKGDEDYEFLSDEYIEFLNKDRDDISYTKDVYRELELVTKLTETDIKTIEVKKDGFIVTVDITSQIKGCVSESKAVEIGYTGGIGSTGVMSFIYTVKDINGSFKLADSIQTK